MRDRMPTQFFYRVVGALLFTIVMAASLGAQSASDVGVTVAHGHALLHVEYQRVPAEYADLYYVAARCVGVDEPLPFSEIEWYRTVVMWDINEVWENGSPIYYRGLWLLTKDGGRQIVLEEASVDKMRSVAIHEMVHDLLAQKLGADYPKGDPEAAHAGQFAACTGG